MFTPTGRPSWCLLICILVAVKTVVTNSDFCNVTRSTKKVVPTCPDSLDKWNEASKRKNCTQYASQCSEPEKLEYHCVINPFINETLEVCAYGQYIVSGHCTEYSSSGNLIQPNLNTNCMNFSSKPCPFAYKSTEAYKYTGCYNLTKKTTVTEQTEAKSDPKCTTVASYISSSQIFVTVVNEDNAERSTGVLTIGLIAVLVLVLITSVLLLLLIRHLKKKHYRSRGNRYVVKDFEKNSNEVLHFTNVENENGNNEIAPSGQQIYKGKEKLDGVKRPKTGGGPPLPPLTQGEETFLRLADGEPHLSGLQGGIDTDAPSMSSVSQTVDPAGDHLEQGSEEQCLTDTPTISTVTSVEKVPTVQVNHGVKRKGKTDAGDRKKITVEVEEDETPEIPLMEDEDPDEECQRLVQVFNDTLTKIVFIQHEHGHNEVTRLDERFDNLAFLSDASTEKIREESQYLKSYEEQIINYFKRERNVKKEV